MLERLGAGLRVDRGILAVVAALALIDAACAMLAGSLFAFGHPALLEAFERAERAVWPSLCVCIGLLSVAVQVDSRWTRLRSMRVRARNLAAARAARPGS